MVSLHVPLTPETEGIINRETLACMKRSAYLINTARGALIADDDLHEALTSGIIAGAALDVLREEPPRGTPRLLTLPNLVITPHAAWNSDAAIPELRVKAAEGGGAILQGGTPQKSGQQRGAFGSSGGDGLVESSGGKKAAPGRRRPHRPVSAPPVGNVAAPARSPLAGFIRLCARDTREEHHHHEGGRER